MRWQLVAQVAFSGGSALGHLATQLIDLSHQGVNALLLLVDQLVELFEQVFGIAGFDFQCHQALFCEGILGHACIGPDFLILDWLADHVHRHEADSHPLRGQ